jgi:hypothetical protein
MRMVSCATQQRQCRHLARNSPPSLFPTAKDLDSELATHGRTKCLASRNPQLASSRSCLATHNSYFVFLWMVQRLYAGVTIAVSKCFRHKSNFFPLVSLLSLSHPPPPPCPLPSLPPHVDGWGGGVSHHGCGLLLRLGASVSASTPAPASASATEADALAHAPSHTFLLPTPPHRTPCQWLLTLPMLHPYSSYHR